MKKTIDPAGFDTVFEYNTNNWLVKRTDAEGRVWQYHHDALGRVLLVIDPLDHNAETRAYTENGMLASIEDARHNQTDYEYDGFDRLKKRIYPDQTFEEYEYDDNGNVLTLTTRNEDEIVNTYDVLNRLSTRQPGALPLQTLTYDLASRQLSISTPPVMGDPGSGEFSWGYDTAGRLILQEMPDGKTVGYQLDANGNRTRLIYPDGYYAEYVFDELNRLTDIKLNGASTAAISFGYDDLSRRTLLTYENGVECEYGYSINNDLRSLAHTFTGSSAGNSVSFQFSYNKVHQVTGMSCSNSQYVWSPRMSRSTVYAPANDLNQYPEVAGATYSYNENGCQTEGVISGTALSASYDELNRLTQAVRGAVTNDYLYDPTNRQAQKSVNSVKTRLLYDGQQLIEEYDDAGDLACRYIRGNGLDEILIKIEASGSTKTYLHHDRLGSVIAITDDTGALLESYNYGPFGETGSLSGSGSPSGTAFAYTGQRYDQELGLYNYKARYYNPETGRFLQPDPIGFDAGDLNLYAYVGNDSVNLADPIGLAAGAGGDYRSPSSIYTNIVGEFDWIIRSISPQLGIFIQLLEIASNIRNLPRDVDYNSLTGLDALRYGKTTYTTDLFVARGHTVEGRLTSAVPPLPHREYSLDEWAGNIRASKNYSPNKSIAGEVCYLATRRDSLGGKSMAQLIAPKLGLNPNRFFMAPDGGYFPGKGVDTSYGTAGVWRAFDYVGNEIGTANADANKLIESLPEKYKH